MTLRTRLALLVSASVAVVIVLASAAAFVATRSQLRGQVDRDLLERARLASRVEHLPRPGPGIAEIRLVGFDVILQVVQADGETRSPLGQPIALPVDEGTLAVARTEAPPFLADVTSEGIHLRMMTVPARPGRALQLARPLTEVDRSLRGLALTLGLVSLAGVAVALGLGVAIAGGALAPVRRLTRTAENIAETQDLEQPIPVDRTDEIGRLAAAFNEMLAALAESRRRQERLVTDAGHELRTPLTSLRTNMEVLHRAAELDPEERARLLEDVELEMRELTALVNELVELARDPRSAHEEPTDLRLEEIAREVAGRARRRTGREVTVRGSGTVRGRAGMLERAIANLVDNACRWGPEGRPVEVTIDGGRVAVRDHGPGIAEADRPHVFERFYRSAEARATPGSGLGLAIVKHVAEAHGGTVFLHPYEDGVEVGFEILGGS